MHHDSFTRHDCVGGAKKSGGRNGCVGLSGDPQTQPTVGCGQNRCPVGKRANDVLHFYADCVSSCRRELGDYTCNALQRTAKRCNALQRTATHCNALQRAAMHCNALQRTAPHCNMLRYTAIHCNTLQRADPRRLCFKLSARTC